jgi:hypothetical protein
MRKLYYRLGLIILLCILPLLACDLSTPPGGGPPEYSYTMTWHPQISGFSDVSLTLTPFFPPKALNFKPSDYVKVDVKVGSSFELSSDDPRYQCVETAAATTLPILFAPESEVVSGFAAISDFLVIYQACGSFLSQPSTGFLLQRATTNQELIFIMVPRIWTGP